MILELLAVEATEPITLLATGVGLVLATWLGKSQFDRRRNNRPNNIDNHRLTGDRRPSDSKPGLGEVCLEHSRKIVDFSEVLGRLASYQENFQERQVVIDKRLEAIQGGMATLLSRPTTPHSGA